MFRDLYGNTHEFLKLFVDIVKALLQPSAVIIYGIIQLIDGGNHLIQTLVFFRFNNVSFDILVTTVSGITQKVVIGYSGRRFNNCSFIIIPLLLVRIQLLQLEINKWFLDMILQVTTASVMVPLISIMFNEYILLSCSPSWTQLCGYKESTFTLKLMSNVGLNLNYIWK